MDCVCGLEYRGEGNCAIAFANPKTRQVYRLVKKDYTKASRSTLQQYSRDEAIKNVESEVKTKLEDTIMYITNIMNPLLSFDYAVIPELISIPNGFGEQAVKQIEKLRPVHRRSSHKDQVDSDISSALVLCDCCFIRTATEPDHAAITSTTSKNVCSKAEDVYHSRGEAPSISHHINCHIHYNTQHSKSKPKDTFSQRINTLPKEEDMLCYEKYLCNRSNFCSTERLNESSCKVYHSQGDVHNKLNCWKENVIGCHRTDCTFNNKVNQSLFSSHDCSCVQLPDNCSMDHTVSFSSLPSKESLSSFTISIEIKPKKAFKTAVQEKDIANQMCRFCMHKSLKTKHAKWPETSSYCPLDLFSGDKKRMRHALISLIKTPQNNLKICKNGSEIYGSDIREDLSHILKAWFPDCKDKRPRLTSSFINLVIEILLRVPKREASPVAQEISSRRAQVLDTSLQTCRNSSYVHCDNECQVDGLPTGCILERIQSIQALDTVDITGIFPLYTHIKQRMEAEPTLRNKWCLDGPYTDVAWLGVGANAADNLQPGSDEWAVNKLKQFLVSKTLQDCSIIAAIQPVSESMEQDDCECLWFEGHLYRYSISLVDLEPKSFEKVMTYFRQASEIADSLAESSMKDGGDDTDDQGDKEC